MLTLQAAPTHALASSFLDELRALLDAAFDGDFTDEDWAHTIGGMHVWLIGARDVISYASLVERTLVCSGLTLRVGYVEAVATAVAERRKGHGARVMHRVNELIQDRYASGGLMRAINPGV